MPEQNNFEQIMFRSYGLFWRADRVFWGWQGKQGHLKGQEIHKDTRQTKTTSPDRDFKDQIGIYALYYDFELVYIGQVGASTKDDRGRTLLGRLKAHRDDHLSERWDRFSWFGLRDVKSSEGLTKLRNQTLRVSRGQILDMFEGVVIAFSEPKLNLQRGNLKGHATQYSQWYSQEELDGQADKQAELQKRSRGIK